MLQYLRIRNLALLEAVELEFGPGFTAVTGETGAGKSILLGALQLLAGARADKTVIRQGAAVCEVEAALHFPKSAVLDDVLDRLELPRCEEGVLLLKRSVAREKAPRISVNGGLATLAALQELGERWIDFHGPGEPRRLLKAGCQLELLDLFAGNREALARYAGLYQAWRELLAKVAKLAAEKQLSPDQIEYLRGEVESIDGLELSDENVEALERDFQRMNRAQELLNAARAVAEGLSGDEGLLGRLAPLVREGRGLEQLDPASKPLVDRLAALAVEAEDIGREFETLGGDFSFEPEQVETLTTRMEAWLDAKRKYGGSVSAVLEAAEEMRGRLAIQGDLAGAMARLEKEIATAKALALAAARELRTVREKAARELAKAAGKRIVELGFKKAEFSVRLTTEPDLGPAGDCTCEFLFSPNVGEAPLPLHKIASSGELARVMLALKTILADLDQVPLLVFDEVDANVGGEIGRIVGEQMAGIAKKHQVLCVTHLPQVAAQAANHLVVEKDQSGERAEVTIRAIHEEKKARIEELARMLGDRTAKAALQHAAELLKG
ncbi:MAG: DNA repair protein RecN [Opitutaceae bacterium]|nr:DNA repair protein RecN [Opitutaceae bacterium]